MFDYSYVWQLGYLILYVLVAVIPLLIYFRNFTANEQEKKTVPEVIMYAFAYQIIGILILGGALALLDKLIVVDTINPTIVLQTLFQSDKAMLPSLGWAEYMQAHSTDETLIFREYEFQVNNLGALIAAVFYFSQMIIGFVLMFLCFYPVAAISRMKMKGDPMMWQDIFNPIATAIGVIVMFWFHSRVAAIPIDNILHLGTDDYHYNIFEMGREYLRYLIFDVEN